MNDVQTYEQQISFFHHMACSVTLSVSPLHCYILKLLLYLTFSPIMETQKVD